MGRGELRTFPRPEVPSVRRIGFGSPVQRLSTLVRSHNKNSFVLSRQKEVTLVICRYCSAPVPRTNPSHLKNFCDDNHKRLFYRRDGSNTLPTTIAGYAQSYPLPKETNGHALSRFPARPHTGVWGGSPRPRS